MGVHMIIMFVLFAISVSCGFDSLVTDNNNEFRISVISGVIGILSFILLVVGTSKLEKMDWTYSDQPYATEKIVALNDNNMMSGRMYMRRGYIESDLYYQYMVKLGNGGYKANRVKSDNATLYYSDGNYRVEWCKKTKQWLWFKTEGKYNKIYIPEGSITDDYSVDLE